MWYRKWLMVWYAYGKCLFKHKVTSLDVFFFVLCINHKWLHLLEIMLKTAKTDNFKFINYQQLKKY